MEHYYNTKVTLFKTKRVKEEINKNPENFQEIINNSEYAISIVDKGGSFTAVNDRYCKIYGYTREELIGHHFSMISPGSDKKQLSKLHNNFIQEKVTIASCMNLLAKDGVIMKLKVDERYIDNINNDPHKITFVELVEVVEDEEENLIYID